MLLFLLSYRGHITYLGDSSMSEIKFCPYCGAPLTISAIASYQENREELVKSVLNSLKNTAKENKTDSFKEILKIYND